MKKMIPFVCVMMSILMITVFATIQGYSENDDSRKVDASGVPIQIIETEPIENLSRFDRMVAKLNEQIEDDAEFNITLVNYKYLEDGYKIETSILNYLCDLIISGYNGIDVIDCAYFWLDTNEDISIVKQMCDWKIKNAKYEGKFWEENAFNAVTKNKCGVLYEEDFEKYIAKGITIDKIMIANRLCRKGVYTIQEILEKYERGIAMSNIALEIDGIVYQAENLDSATVYNLNSTYETVSDSEIFDSRELSIISGNLETAYLKTTESEVSIADELDEVSEVILSNIKEELKDGGYFRTKETEVE